MVSLFCLLCAQLLFHICEKKIGIKSIWTQLLAKAMLELAIEKIRFPRNVSSTVQYPQTKKVCVCKYTHTYLTWRSWCPKTVPEFRYSISSLSCHELKYLICTNKYITKNNCAPINKINRKLRIYFYSSLSLDILIIFLVWLINRMIHSFLID